MKMNLILPYTQRSNMPFKPYKQPDIGTVGQQPQEVTTQEQPLPSLSSQEKPKSSGTMAFLGDMAKEAYKSVVRPLATPFAGFAAGVTGHDVELPGWLGSAKGSNVPEQQAKIAGGAALEAASLIPATKLVGGASKLAKVAKATEVPLQAGLSSAGSELQKEDSTLGSTLGAFGVGAAAGKIGEKVGGALQSGVGKSLKEGGKDIIRKAFPFLTNIPKTETQWALRNAEKVVPKMKLIAEAEQTGEKEAAESVLRSGLKDKAVSMYEAAKKSAGEAFQKGMETVKAQFPEAKGSLEAMRGSVKALAKEVGPGITADEKTALKEMYKTIAEHSDASIDGFIKLKQKLFPFMERAEQGSPAHRLADLMYSEVDNELNRMTNGAMKPINNAYREFKDAAFEVKPIWSQSAKEDTSRNFVNGLLSQAKSGSLDAIKKLEKIAGGEHDLASEVKAARIARAMNWEKAPTGSRIRDNLVSALFGGGGASVGSLFGPAGSFAGGTLGVGLGTKLTQPKFLSQFIFDELEKQGTKLPSSVQQSIGKLVQDPNFIKAFTRAMSGGEETPETISEDVQDTE